MSWAPPPISVQVANSQIAHDILIAGWPDAPGGAIPGLSEIHAAGVLAQFQAESAFDPTAVGDHGNAKGLGQWWPARRANVEEGCGINIDLTPDTAAQARAALWELSHPEHVALAAILTSATPYDAGVAGCVKWMRPSPPDNSAARGNMAEKLFARFNPS